MSGAEIASKTPFAIEVEAGTDYWWCACGKSKSQPFYDGSHKGTVFAPIQYMAVKSEKVWFCGANILAISQCVTAVIPGSDFHTR